MITKEIFFEKYNITEELFLSAEISWEDLCYIHDDFEKKISNYEEILESFMKTYLRDIHKKRIKNDEKIKIHSFRSRIKEPEHLMAKIIRKKQDNQDKYKNLDKTNYEKFVTDLIGIRCLILFKADWINLHNYIISQFDNKTDYYIRDSLADFDNDENHFYIAEMPKVHIRNGDSRDIYEEVLPPNYVIDGKDYRSVHYIIKYRGVYLEIQVRTLFEEGWGEINHELVYPYFQDNKILNGFTELLNRLSGLADEMGDFFCELKILEAENQRNSQVMSFKTGISNNLKAENRNLCDTPQKEVIQQMGTPCDCLKTVFEE